MFFFIISAKLLALCYLFWNICIFPCFRKWLMGFPDQQKSWLVPLMWVLKISIKILMKTFSILWSRPEPNQVFVFVFLFCFVFFPSYIFYSVKWPLHWVKNSTFTSYLLSDLYTNAEALNVCLWTDWSSHLRHQGWMIYNNIFGTTLFNL